MGIRRKALDEVGLFDERYYMYVEDLDLCKRMWNAGWEMCITRWVNYFRSYYTYFSIVF